MHRLRAILLIGLVMGCGAPARAEQTVETQAMVARLRAARAQSEQPGNVYANAARVAAARQFLAEEGEDRSDRDRRMVRFSLALDLIRAGMEEEAVEILTEMRDAIAASAAPMPRNLRTVTTYLALAHLRRGESCNCIAQRTNSSCIYPIIAGGVHRDRSGSQAARGLYEAMLAETPDDLAARWLLHIAGSTLGDPSAGSMPMEDGGAFASPLQDRAADLGVDVLGRAGGSVAADFDNDGDLDLMCSAWGLGDQVRVFAYDDGAYVDGTEDAGITGITGGLNLVHADYDNDGYVDVLVLRGAWMGHHGQQPNSLLRNLGPEADGRIRFSDVTVGAGVLSERPTQAAGWCDFDRDGDLDLFIGNESGEAGRFPCELFENNGDGTFRERAADVGAAHVGYVKAVAIGDVDGDGWDDIYLSCDAEPNLLLRNLGPQAEAGFVRFADVTDASGVREPIESFPTWFWDVDQDGDDDLFVAGYGCDGIGDITAARLALPDTVTRPRLYINDGTGRFEDHAASHGLDVATMAMGAGYGDLDMDGWYDFYLGTGEPDLRALVPNLLFRGGPGGVFENVTAAARVGHLQKGHGVSFADLDRDGDQDIFTTIGGAYEGDVAYNALYETPGAPARSWVTLHLEGARSNRAAIGARVTLTARMEDGGSRTFHRRVGHGASFGGASLALEIGLDDAVAIESITVRWPIGDPEATAPESFTGAAPRGRWLLREGAGRASKLDSTPLPFRASDS